MSNALRAFLSFEEKFNDSLINIITDYLQKAPKDVISPQNRSNQLKTLRQGYKKALKTTSFSSETD